MQTIQRIIFAIKMKVLVWRAWRVYKREIKKVKP